MSRKNKKATSGTTNTNNKTKNGNDNISNKKKKNDSVLGSNLRSVLVVLILSIILGCGYYYSEDLTFGDQVPEWINDLVDRIDNDEEIQNVLMDLPSVEVSPPMKNAKLLETAGFKEFISGRDGKNDLRLVSFFDSRSEAFLVTRNDLDKAALLIHKDPELHGIAELGIVNCAVDSYLQEIYSPEMLSSWQENAKDLEQSHKGFRFGKHNYFPLITKLFKNGRAVDEYTDAVRPDLILQFLQRHNAPNITEITKMDQGIKFAQTKQPNAILCGSENKDQLVGSFFQNISRIEHGWLYYAIINDEEMCEKIVNGLKPNDIAVMTLGGKVSIFKAETSSNKPVEKVSNDDKIGFTRRAMNFLAVNRDPLLIELTPDNSWDLIRTFPYLVILLIDLRDKTAFSKSLEILEEVSTSPGIVEHKSLLKFCYASGRNFASQYDLTMEQLPNLLVYDAREEVVSTFHPGTKEVKHEMLLEASKEKSIENVVNWMTQILPPTSKNKNGTSDTIPIGELDQLKFSNLVDEIVGSAPPPSPKEEKQEGEDMKKKTEQQRQKMSWRDLREVNMHHQRHMSIEEVWSDIFEYYGELLLFEESYQKMDKTKQNLAENKVLREILDSAFSYLSDRKHLQLIFNAIPITPTKLGELSKVEVEKLWVDIQKLSAYKSVLFEKGNRQNHTKDELRAIDLFRQDAVFLRNSIVRIMKQRNDKYMERFRNENGGRDPDVNDHPTLGIDRISVKDLSMEKFINEYAKKRKPVIITDLKLFKEKWTKQHIGKKCGGKKPKYVEKGENLHTWGGLTKVEESNQLNLTEFLDTHSTNKTRKNWYLHDWSLPRNCPEIMGEPPFDEFIYPRYFAGDYFQRMPFVGYQHTWPSLFVGANQTESAMHIDSGGTNFWMYLIEGVKEWRFFDRFDKLNLYAEPGSSHFYVDVFRRDFTEHPLLATAPMYQGTQLPGDLVFIPGGCPHGVRNFDDIVGVSMNYLDVSNEDIYLWIQLVDENYRDYELYSNPEFPRGLKSNQKDLTLGEFKSRKWYEIKDELDLF